MVCVHKLYCEYNVLFATKSIVTNKSTQMKILAMDIIFSTNKAGTFVTQHVVCGCIVSEQIHIVNKYYAKLDL